MITTKINVSEFLAEWCRAKFYDPDYHAVRFPPSTDIYEKVYDVTMVRPCNASRDDGNLEFCLPEKYDGNYSYGKNPEKFNYISERGAKIIEKKLRIMFWAEVHETMDENKHLKGIDYKDTAYMLIRRYSITGITDDAIKKHYQRWRDKLRRKQKREYVFQKKR